MGYPHYPGDCSEYHDVVCDYRGMQPKIAVLCGSTRFYDGFRLANLQLTVRGLIVLSIGCDTRTDGELFESGEDVDVLKLRLDELHKRKIDLADIVYVITDDDDYIGESTRSEIEYAERFNKQIIYLPHGRVADGYR